MSKKEWLLKRKSYLGGTDIAALCGLSPYRTALSVYLEKTSPDIIEIEQNSAMKWGNLLEDIIAQEYSSTTGYEITKPEDTILHPAYSFLGVNIDRWVNNKTKILECKTASLVKAKDWGAEGTDEIPEAYLVQVAYYAAICDVPEVDIAVLIGGQDFRVYKYQRLPELEEKLIKIAISFWRNHVLAGVAPKCANMADTLNLFPKSMNRSVIAQAEILHTICQLNKAREEEEQLNIIINGLKTKIQEFMRDAEVLMDHNGKVLATWKNTSPRISFNTKKFKESYPDLYLNYVERSEKISRTFLLKTQDQGELA